MIQTEKMFKKLGFDREIEYYDKYNLEIIKEVRYVRKTKDEIFEIVFNLFGDYKDQIDMRIYTADGIALPTPNTELSELIMQKKKELGLK